MSTAATIKAYNAGWRAGLKATPEAIARADRRKAPAAWYLGFFDAEGGEAKYAGLDAATDAVLEARYQAAFTLQPEPYEPQESRLPEPKDVL